MDIIILTWYNKEKHYETKNTTGYYKHMHST